jgi:TetR/AcrR family transcriptional regulator
MTRVLTGDALVNEDERLQIRINQLHDRLEASLKQSLRLSEMSRPDGHDPTAEANVLLCYVIGRWQLFAKTRFKRPPSEQWEAQKRLLLG